MSEHEDDVVRRCLPIVEWPEQDRVAWEGAHRSGGLLDDDGLAASWAPATSVIIASGYGRYLSFLAETGDLDPNALPATRIDRARVESYVIHLRKRNHSNTVAGRVRQLIRAMAVMAPAVELAWLRRILARLRRMAQPARDDRMRLVPATVVRDLGFLLMERAEEIGKVSVRRRALLFRDGLMISILIACPVRARNVAAMSIGTSLQRRGNEWWVVFNEGETKNCRAIEMPLPHTFTGFIDRYIAQHRPLLMGRSPAPILCDALWMSDGGMPLTAKEVGQRVSAVTKRELGRCLNPHLFRKIVPTDLAIRDPAYVGIATTILGHADFRTTQRAYNLARALDAAGRYHALVQSIRNGSGPTQRPANRTELSTPSTDRALSVIRISRRSSVRSIP